MSNVINTNVASLNAQANLVKTNRSLETGLERLSSGFRINSAADDAAGLAIANRIDSQIGGLRQAIRNANDGISLAQTAEGAMEEVTSMLTRMRTLAVQSSNDTNDNADRALMQKEMSQLQDAITSIADSTRFSGKKLLDGTATDIAVQVGAFAGESVNFNIRGVASNSIGNHNSSTGVMGGSTQAGAGQNAIAGGTVSVLANGVSKSITVSANEMADSIANKFNTHSASTDVTATAETNATFSVSGADTFTFSLTGTSSATISATVSDSSDLTNILDAVNAQSSTTGISASFDGSDKSSLTFTHSTGKDIDIQSFASSGAATATLTGSKSGDAGVTLDDGGTAFGTVSGEVTLSSSNGFVTSDASTTIFSSATTASSLNAVSSVDISSRSGAQDALAVLDSAKEYIDTQRSDLGAIQNRLTSTINNTFNVANNLEGAKSQIMDADFAQETAQMTKNQILQQAGISILAQANAKPQAVLSLLQ